MKRFGYIYILLLVLLIFLGFKRIESGALINKLKTLTQIIRLVQDNYFEEINFDNALEGAIKGFLNELDPHSQYISKKEISSINEQFQGNFEGIGIEYSIIDDYITVISPIPGTPSDRAGLQAGDQIIKINNESAFKISTEEVYEKLRGPKGSPVTIHVKRQIEEAPFEITLIRDKIPIVSIIASYMINQEIGYVKINRFAEKTHKELEAALKRLEFNGLEKLILDLRNNGGGLLNQSIDIANLFISSNDTLVYTRGKINNANAVYLASKSNNDKNYPVIILINNGSASASEIVSGAIQDLDRGLIVGEKSFGKGLVQRQYNLSDGSAARITIAEYFTPSGRHIQRDYNKGWDEYYSIENIKDSTFFDKPQYKTRNGRIVYGGGGITPDYLIPMDKDYIDFLKSALRTNPERLIFKYANEKKHEIYQNFSSFDDFYKSVNSKEIEILQLDAFLEWLSTNKFDFDKPTLQRNWLYIQNEIYSEIGNALWGKDSNYKIKGIVDSQLQKAIELLEKSPNSNLFFQK